MRRPRVEYTRIPALPHVSALPRRHGDGAPDLNRFRCTFTVYGMTTTTIAIRRCERCLHEWFPRKVGPPKKCPRCQAPYPRFLCLADGCEEAFTSRHLRQMHLSVDHMPLALDPDARPESGPAVATETQPDLAALAKRIRRHVVRMVYGAQSGHIGGSLSATDILSVLFTSVLRHDPARPDWPDRDRFIMSKGHCTPVQYAVLAEVGYLPVEELETFRRAGTRLQGHSVIGNPPGVDNSAGSLGMGLSFGLGVRLAARLENRDLHAYVMMGDGEQDEGQVWEAAMAAPHHHIDRLVAIVDRNGIQNDDFTAKTMSSEPLDEKYRSFGWAVRSDVDGHNFDAIEEALVWARDVRGQPGVRDLRYGEGQRRLVHGAQSRLPRRAA